MHWVAEIQEAATEEGKRRGEGEGLGSWACILAATSPCAQWLRQEAVLLRETTQMMLGVHK